MEAIENKNNVVRLVLVGGGLLILTSLVLGPPVSLFLFPVGGIMVIVGGHLKRKSAPPVEPLSRKSAKSKIWAGIPAVALIAISLSFEQGRVLTGGAGLFLLAYFIVGLAEMYLDKKSPNAKERWERMQSWKKFIVSVAAILIALIGFISLIPFGAKILNG